MKMTTIPTKAITLETPIKSASTPTPRIGTMDTIPINVFKDPYIFPLCLSVVSSCIRVLDGTKTSENPNPIITAKNNII